LPPEDLPITGYDLGMTIEILQSVGVIALAYVGAIVGGWFASRKTAWWTTGFILPLIVILMIGATRRWYPLGLEIPFRWLVTGRTEFALIAPLASMLMITPILRMPNNRSRTMAGIFVALFAVQASVMPFLMPGLQRAELSKLHTDIRNDGVCRQSTDYTCGPAAAVTALRALGVNADEGEIAVLAHTSRSTGTEPDVLAQTLQSHFATQHLRCTYQAFHSAADLPTDRPTIALINYKFLVDHYVTVLKVGTNQLTIGDPLSGITHESFEAFERDWRKVGIVVEHDAAR
jgi:predicted double-glycine peptidase